MTEQRTPRPGETWHRINDPEDIAMVYEVRGGHPTVYWTSPANAEYGRPVAKTWATRMDDFIHDFMPPQEAFASCRQPERFAAGDRGTDPATEGRNTPEPCSDVLGRLYPFPHWHPHNGEGTCVRCGQVVDQARQPVAHGYDTRPVAVDPLPRPLSEHCRLGRCLALTCCSYECSRGRCPSIPAEFRKPTP